MDNREDARSRVGRPRWALCLLATVLTCVFAARAEVTEPLLRIDGRTRFFARGVPKSLAVDRQARQIAVVSGGEVTLFDGPDARSTTVLQRKSYVIELAFSPDGRRLLGPSAYGHMVVWDTRTRRVLTEPSRKISEEHIRHASFSADANRLAFSDGRKRVGVMDLASGKRLSDVKLSNGILCLRLSPGGRRFAYGQSTGNRVGYGGRVTIRTVAEEGKAPQPVVIDLPNSPALLSFSPDGQKLAVFARRFGSYIYDSRTGKKIRDLSGTPGKCLGLEISPDGRTVLLSYPATDLGLLEPLAEPPAGTEAATRPATGPAAAAATAPAGRETIEIDWQGKYPQVVAFSPEGKTFAVATRRGNEVRLYDAATGRRKTPPPGVHTSGITVLTPAGPGRLLSGDAAGRLCLWRLSDGGLLAETQLPEVPFDAAFSPDGRRVAVITLGGPAVGELPAADADPPGGRQTSAPADADATDWSLRPLFDPAEAEAAIGQRTWQNSAQVAWLDGDRILCTGYRAQRVYNARSGELLTDALENVQGSVRRTVGPALSPEGRFFAELQSTGLLPVGRSETGEILTVLKGSGGFKSAIPTRHGRRIILTQASPAAPTMIETFTGRTLWRNEKHYSQAPTFKHGIDRNERLLVRRGPFGSRQGGRSRSNGPYRLRVIDLIDGRAVGELFPHMRYVTHACFTDDGRIAVGVTDGTIAVYAAPEAPPLDAKAEDLPKLWQQLAAEDPAAGMRAVFAMVELGDAAVAFLDTQLAPADRPEVGGISKLIDRLNADRYADRVAAEKALRGLGPQAASALREALAGDLTAQQRAVLRRLLAESRTDALADRAASQAARALEVLARIHSPVAVKLLGRLASGYEADGFTRQARQLLSGVARTSPTTVPSER